MRKTTAVALLGGFSLALVGGVAVLMTSGPGPLPACDARTYLEDAIAAARALKRPKSPDSVTSAEILIDASPQAIWDIVKHFETVWPASNPAHMQTCVVTRPETVHDDMVYHDVERVGGITASMYAHVYDVIPARRFRWKANATYDLGPVNLPIQQGGTFVLEPEANGTRVSHEVWAEFPDTVGGKAAKWVARNVMGMEQSAVEHNQVELEYFRAQAE